MVSSRIVVVLGAAIAVAAQLFLAPHIALFGAVPNVLLAFCLALAVVRSSSYGCVLPFVLGLVFDFVGGGPVGLMAFVLMVVTVLVAWLFGKVDNDSLFMAFALMAIGTLVVEVLYAALLLVFGYQATFVDAFIFRVLPCFLYDFALACVAHALLSRVAKPAATVRAELTQLR